jgi:hypothetical protein
MSPPFSSVSTVSRDHPSLVSMSETYFHRDLGCQNLISLLFLDLENRNCANLQTIGPTHGLTKKGEVTKLFLLHIFFMGKIPIYGNKVLEIQI